MLDSIFGGLLIFVLRVCDMSVDTLRVMSMVRGRKVRATLFALIEATIFITAIVKVLSPPIQVWDMTGFACGFAGGTFTGMTVAKLLATDHVLIRVISPRHGEQICQSLRGVGFAVTVLQGEGRSRPVPILFSVVERGDGERFLGLARQVDPEAFVVTEPIDLAAGGFVPRPVNGLIASDDSARATVQSDTNASDVCHLGSRKTIAISHPVPQMSKFTCLTAHASDAGPARPLKLVPATRCHTHSVIRNGGAT